MIPSTFERRLSSLRVELLLRGLMGILIFMGWSSLRAQPLTGTHNITGTSAFNASGGQFATIQEAFDSLMARGVGSGGVTFRVQDAWATTSASTGLNAEPNTIRLSTYSGSAPNAPVLLTFADLTDSVYLAKSPATSAGDRFVFRFTGSFSYFTLDGANKLILKSTATGGNSTGLIGFVSTASPSLDLNIDAITVRNIIMHGNRRDSTFVGVYIGGDATLPSAVSGTSSVGAVRGITIEGCTIDSVSRPIHVAGIRTNTKNIRILADTLGNPGDPTAWIAINNIGAVHLRGVVNPVVRGCVVHGAESATNYQASGVRLDTCENFTIERNWIYNIRYTGTGGWGSHGIFINMPASFIGSPNNVVANNMIAGISADGFGTTGLYWISGIFVQGSASLTDNKLFIVHNSINLYGTYSGSSTFNGSSSGITLASSISGGVTIQGNLIQNTFKAAKNDTAQAIAILTTSSTLGPFNINYNQYYVGGSAATVRFGRFGNGGIANFSQWQGIAALGNPDANGMMHLPGPIPFVSNTDLHLVDSSSSSAINAGDAALYNSTLDFDAQIRPLPSPPGTSGNTPPDPGNAPDIGADELDGTPFSCPSSLQAPEIVVTATYPPLASSNYLWGQQVEIDTGTNSPAPSGSLNLAYSFDGGNTWTAGPPVTAFPVTINLPPLTPPNYTATLHIAVVATTPGICPPLTPDTSNTPVIINIADRPGNRAATAISVTLAPSGSGTWTAVIQDSTDGPGVSNEYFSPPRGRTTKDLFFKLDWTSLSCLDSLVVDMCGTSGSFDTYLHVVNATTQDTIDSDDGCGSGNKSKVVALGLPNIPGHNLDEMADPARDSLLLVSGHDIYIVVEGYSGEGNFELTITGYKLRPSSINVSGAPSGAVCINSNPVTLDATTPGATAYQWLDANSNPVGNSATYTVSPSSEGTVTLTAQAIFNPNQDPSCPQATDTVSAIVTITVEDTARAQIADASNNIVSGQTLTVTAGSNVTFNASSPQTSGNTYNWELYNSNPPSAPPAATGTGSSFTINNAPAGSHTLILEAVRGTGACGPTRDTVYLDVTMGLRADLGGFAIYPNPNTGTFTITAPAAGRYQVQVLDVAGRLVATEAFEGTAHQMRLSLPAGVYQIRLTDGGKTSTERLIITE